MKILSLGCQTMKEGVIVSFVFFILGMLFILSGAYLIPNVFHLQHITLFIGFILLLFSPIILISTFLLTVIPQAQKRLENCDH